MKKLLCIFMAVLMLSACKAEETREYKAKAVPAKAAFECEIIPNDEGNRAWIDGGRVLAVQKGYKVRYFDRNEKLIGEIELFAGPDEPENCVFSNHGIFMGTKGGKTAVCFVEDEWRLCGGNFFDREGNIVRKLPEKEGKETDTLCVTNVRWLGEDVLAVCGENKLFFYRISEDKLYLSEGTDNICLPA